MPDFLLEIGCEEVPARMIDDARKQLVDRVHDLVSRERLWTRVETTAYWSTPRRLALRVEGIFQVQQDIHERVQGPAVKVAYKDGKPTAAAEAFAKKAGIDVSNLERMTTPKGEYLVATIVKKGRSASAVLAEALPKEIAAICWPKNMYWRIGKPEQFVRPVRWIVAMIGSEVVPLEFGGVRAGSQTRGHRLLGAAALELANQSQYETELASAKVIVDSREREQRIRKTLDAATRAVAGARWREDPELLQTVVNLTEWPSAILGNFDRQLLSLPEEVLVTVMRDHQKYFAVEDAAHKLAPHFLAVLNTDGDPDGLIRHGNERVLRARFNDARFFWNFDNSSDFRQRRELLRRVSFHKELGNYYEKTERMERLAASLADTLVNAGFNLDQTAVAEAAQFAKNDLTTELVREFTELQGIIGGRYAEQQGMRQGVADAIYDQYKPASMEDAVPRTLEGAIVSIVDKADSIAGMFGWTIPSGSKDPFALRRQANGIVKIIAEYKLPVKISALMADAREGYRSSTEARFLLDRDAAKQAIGSFFRERLEFYLRDFRGLAYDVVNATLAADADDVVDALARALAVAKVRPSADFEPISISFKRMKNILRQAQETNKRVAHPFNPALLQEGAEKNLAAQIPQVAAKVNKLRAGKQYEEALLEISRLRPAIDAFFDQVMVMVEKEELRANRLGLLQILVNEFSSIADFSEMVTEKK